MKRKPDLRAEMCQEYYDVLIAALRHVAYRCGFALAVHGSLKRDIDLVACPWREHAIDAESIAQKLRETTEMIIGFARVRAIDANPTKMPCGRLAWSFYLTHEDDGPYIDLSVMPPASQPVQTQVEVKV